HLAEIGSALGQDAAAQNVLATARGRTTLLQDVLVRDHDCVGTQTVHIGPCEVLVDRPTEAPVSAKREADQTTALAVQAGLADLGRGLSTEGQDRTPDQRRGAQETAHRPPPPSRSETAATTPPRRRLRWITIAPTAMTMSRTTMI